MSRGMLQANAQSRANGVLDQQAKMRKNLSHGDFAFRCYGPLGGQVAATAPGNSIFLANNTVCVRMGVVVVS